MAVNDRAQNRDAINRGQGLVPDCGYNFCTYHDALRVPLDV